MRKIIGHRAFTLIEVMVAFTILAIGVLGILPVVVFFVKSNVHNRQSTQARLLAEQYAERLRTVDYENVILADDGDTTDAENVAAPDHVDTVAADGVDYRVMWNIFENFGQQGVKRINIIILWTDPDSRQTKQFNTLEYRAAVSR